MSPRQANEVITMTIDFFILLAEGMVFLEQCQAGRLEHYCVRYAAAEEGE